MIYPSELAQKTRGMFKPRSVVPVLEITDAAHAEPLAHALRAGGITVIEITLRTDAALEAIARISKMDGIVVGAGTILSAQHAQLAIDNGAAFLVSPGSMTTLINTCTKLEVPYLPGASTVSEMMQLYEHGFSFQKFFPAEISGGTKMLASIAPVLQDITFCPTGGITTDNKQSYFSLSNVHCVGGSWIAPKNLIETQNWPAIERNAQQAQSRR